MLYAVLFNDNPAAQPDLRQRHMAAHLEFLAANAGIQAAGPLSEDGNPAGGLWLVQAEDVQQVEALIRKDPFWPTGLRDTHRILAWSQVHNAPR